MEQRVSTLETSFAKQPSSMGPAVSEASSVLRDPYDFSESESVPRTPNCFQHPNQDGPRKHLAFCRERERCLIQDSRILLLGKAEGTILDEAKTRDMFSRPQLTALIIEETNNNSQNQRTYSAKNLVNCIFTNS